MILTNREIDQLAMELNDVLTKELTFKQKFLAMDLVSTISPKLETYGKLQKEIFDTHTTPNSDGKSVTFNDEEGIKLFNELSLVENDIVVNPHLIESIIDVKTTITPVMLYKIYADKEKEK